MDTLDGMRAVSEVARRGSFTAAGKRLGVSTKLVSKYVAAVETRLQTQLFARTTRSVTLTEAGVAYVGRCAAILEQIDELEASLQERRTRLAGPIRITASTGYGGARLSAALADFMRRHPEVSIELHLTNARVAIVEEGFDLAVRVGVLRDSTLIAKRVAPMPMLLYAQPAHLDAVGRPRRPEDLIGKTCLVDTSFADPARWRFAKDGRETVIKVDHSFAANAPAAVYAMAAAGLGVARTIGYVAEEGLARGEVERVLADYETIDSGVYALYPPNRHLTARVRALLDHLAVALKPAGAA